MTQTQAAWIKKIKSWVPSWFYNSENSEIENAYIIALARILESAQIDIETDIAMTFIKTAISSYLDIKGSEFGIMRVAGEFDDSYRTRLRITPTKSNIDPISIKTLVDALLIKGESTITEDFDNNLFLNDNVFCNRSNLLIDKIENTFTIVIDKQVPEPQTFLNRESFCDSQSFVGQVDSTLEFFNIIIQLVNENKAAGTFYRLVERLA